MKRFLIRHGRIIATLFHLQFFLVCIVAAFVLRFDFVLPDIKRDLMLEGAGLSALIKLLAFQLFGLNRGLVRHAELADAGRVFTANLFGSAAFAVAATLIFAGAFPRSVYFIDFMVCLIGTGCFHFGARLYRQAIIMTTRRGLGRRILIYGAGDAGVSLLRDIRKDTESGYEVSGFLDDSPDKKGVMISGVPVLGSGRQVGQFVLAARRSQRPVTEIVIAMPSASPAQMQEAIANCRKAGLPCRTIPGVRELLSHKQLSQQIRNVSVEDLLGRPQVRIEDERIMALLRGKTVLVTGAAGSIGSESCRQIAASLPARLILLDQAESEVYQLENRLRREYSNLNVEAYIGSICDEGFLERIFQSRSIDVVLHAAAYKHVPLMERQPRQSVATNIFGTLNVAHAARRHGVPQFLMISSDKAVNPTSVMGTTKRVAELALAALDGSCTRFVSVRFGNVLGSNGSVIPVFREQIAAGGPVTVTHPEMRRYFMTIPEAVQLVLLASTMGNAAEIFILHMGEPVKVDDLAKNMIRLSGKIPGKDIEIRYVGMRPGEKLFEELNCSDEDSLPTQHPKIRVFRGPAPSPLFVDDWLAEMRRIMESGDERSIIVHLMKIVPEYVPDARWGISGPAQERGSKDPGTRWALAGA